MQKMLEKVSIIIVMTFAFIADVVVGISCTGCVDLDELNFAKTLVRFPYALVKFDIAFPYGEKHEAFAQFSKDAHKITDDLLIATVGIKDYGEMENKALGERYKVDDKNYPGIYLFSGNVDEYVKLPSHLDITLDNLKKFVSEHSSLYIGPEGCLKPFNDAVKNFANLQNDEQLKLIEELAIKAEELKSEQGQENAKFYLTFMKKINQVGYDFIDTETKRLQRLKAGKVSDAKKNEIQRKLNILEVFRVNKLTKDTEKSEL